MRKADAIDKDGNVRVGNLVDMGGYPGLVVDAGPNSAQIAMTTMLKPTPKLGQNIFVQEAIGLTAHRVFVYTELIEVPFEAEVFAAPQQQQQPSAPPTPLQPPPVPPTANAS